MHDRKSPPRQTTGSLEITSSTSTLPRFEIGPLRPLNYGRIRWAFDVTFGPITIEEFRIVVGTDEKPKFVSPPYVKDAFRGVYRSHVKVDRAFLLELFEIVVAQLNAPPEAKPERRPTQLPSRLVEPSETLLQSEGRFDVAFASLDGGDGAA
jgi:hypothetical protein